VILTLTLTLTLTLALEGSYKSQIRKLRRGLANIRNEIQPEVRVRVRIIGTIWVREKIWVTLSQY
jgi:hypothetical protein